jgi:hypothetical protein
MVELLEWLDHARKGRRAEGCKLADAGAVGAQHFPHRRLDVLGADAHELRQRVLMK